MKKIAIITARSGSKGLKDKNIKELNGIPLLVYSINAAKKSEIFDEIMVSTDSKEYADIARKYGASVPFLRSIQNSSDSSSSWDTVLEVLEKYKTIDREFDEIVLLQPTSPLRTSEDIIKADKLFMDKKADAITSVCELDHSPLWCTKLDESLSLEDFRTQIKNMGNRQTLERYYRINGAIYIRRILNENDSIRILNKKDFAYIMERKKSIDIDTIEDFELAEFYLNKTL